MLQGEHSAMLLTFIQLPFVIKIFVLSIFEWPLKTFLSDRLRQILLYSLSLLNSALMTLTAGDEDLYVFLAHTMCGSRERIRDADPLPPLKITEL